MVNCFSVFSAFTIDLFFYIALISLFYYAICFLFINAKSYDIIISRVKLYVNNKMVLLLLLKCIMVFEIMYKCFMVNTLVVL